MFGASAAVTLLVPAALRAQAARLDPEFPHGPVRLHLSALPGRIGAAAFAADGHKVLKKKMRSLVRRPAGARGHLPLRHRASRGLTPAARSYPPAPAW